MTFDPMVFTAGALNFGLAFLAAGGFALIFKAVYRWITPHDEGALIRAGIGKVVASLEDPNPRVAGAGFARLRAAGIEVQVVYLEGSLRWGGRWRRQGPAYGRMELPSGRA